MSLKSLLLRPKVLVILAGIALLAFGLTDPGGFQLVELLSFPHHEWAVVAGAVLIPVGIWVVP